MPHTRACNPTHPPDLLPSHGRLCVPALLEIDCKAGEQGCATTVLENSARVRRHMADDVGTRIQNRLDTANRLAQQLRNKDVEVHDIIYRLGAEMVRHPVHHSHTCLDTDHDASGLQCICS